MFHSRVYIAEADQALQKRLSGALKKNGFDVRVFDSGYPIVEMMDNWPDVFLIDIELPDINGLEICKWLKSHEPSSHIPVIFISGEPYLKILASSAHPDDYIEKPVSIPQVIHKIREFLPLEKVG
jgi:DNA-binding response OmpR family regulator